MRKIYCMLAVLAAGCGLGTSAFGQAAWRPFKPGLIYAFSAPGSSSAHTLRLDSAYVTAGGDSAWTFRRLVKTSNGREQSTNPYGVYRKSKNNLFGARLTWQRTSAAFILENVAEGNAQAAIALQLRPQAPIGSSWAASTTPAITAILNSRSYQMVGSGGVLDSVATITLSTGPVLRLSRAHGLLAGPQWLGTSSSTVQWNAAQLPVPLAQTAYSPLALFNLQPGDELGYITQPFTISSFPDSESHILRRVTSRQQTRDSLIYTFLEQEHTRTFSTPSGGMPGQYTGPVVTRRWVFSLRTGLSPQFRALPLLTGEYVETNSSTQPPLLVGRGILANASGGGCIMGGPQLGFIQVFSGFTAPPGQYHTGIDIGWQQLFSLQLGLGPVFTGDTRLQYYRRSQGTPATCGPAADYANLLPTRAAQAAAIARLHPNPATDAATLTLKSPALPGTRLLLRDGLGRLQRQMQVSSGQTKVELALTGLPAGLYLVQVETAHQPPAMLRVVKQ